MELPSWLTITRERYDLTVPGAISVSRDQTAGSSEARSGSEPEALRRSRLVASAKSLVPTIVVLALAPFVGAPTGIALLFATAVYIGSHLADRISYPLDLMPIARLLMTLLGPVLGFTLIFAVLHLGSGDQEPLDGLVIVTAISAIFAVVADLAGRAWLRRRPLRVAVLGSLRFAQGLGRELEENGIEDVKLLGWLNLGGKLASEDGVSTATELRRAITKHRIDLIVHGTGSDDFGPGSRRAFEQAAEDCSDLPVRTIGGGKLYERLFGHVPMGLMDSAWYLYVSHLDFQAANPRAKRMVDLVLGTLVGLATLPLLALAAIAIKLEDGGSILYRQTRIGEGGREFTIYKLRTMKVDAQALGPKWSCAGDDRATRVGRVLRRLHIDELPQLRNVLEGTMTLVGPRPEQPQMVAELERTLAHYRRRHLVKPGVTGWAQVRCGYAGSVVGTAWKTCHDLYYLKHRTLASDLLIMIETVVGAARDSHRDLRVPDSQFLASVELGLEEGGARAALESSEQPHVLPRPSFNYQVR